jgi:RHS repeat-associated protein
VSQVRTALGVTGEEANEVTTTYTANGQVETVTDAEGNKTTYEYDGHDRLAKTRYRSPTQGAGTSSTSDYEQPTYESLAGGTRTSGLVVAFRNRAGETTGFGYDALGRLTSKDAPGTEPDIAYSYDLLGRMTGASQTDTSLTFAYDALGRNLSQTGASGSYSSRYDLAGRRTRLTHPDGFYVDQEYLVTGEMTVIRENGASSGVGVLATFAYDQLGRRSSVTYGNGETTAYQYDAVSRLSQLALDLGGSATTNDLVLTFAYNPASQIASTTRSNDLYAWSGHGNGSTTSTIDGLNQLASHGGATPSYDARGNLTSDGTRTFGYDSENKMTAFPTIAVHYDPLGRLDGFRSPLAVATEYDGGNQIAERTPGNSNVTFRHVFGPGADEPLVTYSGSGTTDRRFLHADERGSILAVTSSTGSLLAINRYDEYGKPESTSTPYMGRFLYTGQRYYGSPGLYYYKARFYDPRLGRFMQTDPIGYGGGMNGYAYVKGDPVNVTDPLGLGEGGECSDGTCGDISVTVYAPNSQSLIINGVYIDLYVPPIIYVSLDLVFAGPSEDVKKSDDIHRCSPIRTRVLKGIVVKSGESRTGAFGIPIRNGSAAIIYRQFGMSKGELRPYIGGIAGLVAGRGAFMGVTDSIDNAVSPVPGLSTPTAFMKLNPNSVILEIMGPSADQYDDFEMVEFVVPPGVNCPTPTGR